MLYYAQQNLEVSKVYHHSIGDLFDLRNVVGGKLEQLISERTLTKRAVCTNTGISRPTLDKVLAGEVTSKANFEKHIAKLLAYLNMTPDELMDDIDNPFSSTRQLRKVLSMNLQKVSQESGIPVEELKKIEAGEDVPLYELRDLACCLETGVRGLLGENYFQTTVARGEDFLENDPCTVCSPSGFWGHFGILVKGLPKFMWFPVTAYTCSLIRQNQNNQYMVIPCLDNSLLLINNKNVLEMTLLDDACSEPADMDWDYDSDSGAFPAVFYEAFDDYLEFCEEGGNPRQYGISEQLAAAMERTIEQNQINRDDFSRALHSLTVYFEDGTTRIHVLDYYDGTDIAASVTGIYEIGEPVDGSVVQFQDDIGSEVFVNLKRVSMIKLPLEKTEAAIWENTKAALEEP